MRLGACGFLLGPAGRGGVLWRWRSWIRGSTMPPAIRRCRSRWNPTEDRPRRDPLLHRSSDFRHGDFGGLHAGRRRGRVHAAGGAVSRRHAADGAGDRLLSRRQRPDRAGHRGRADRRAGQRRRGHDLHVVAIHQRRRLQPDRDLQARHRLGHGPGAGAEPRLPGPAGDSRRWCRTKASTSRRCRPTR